MVAGLADGRIDLKSFTDEAVLRPEAQTRLADVTVVEDDTPSKHGADVGAAPVTVTLTPASASASASASGSSVSRTITALPGSRQDPLTDSQLRVKWNDCLQRAGGRAPAETIQRLFDEGKALADARSIDGWLGRLTEAVSAD